MKHAHGKSTGPSLSRKLLTLSKWLGIGVLFLCYLIISGIASLLPFTGKTKRNLAIRISSFHARLILMVLNVRVTVKHAERMHTGSEVRLIISNHLSYVDIFIIASLLPSVFITSVELKHTPLLGRIARFAGCLFVERRKAFGLKKEIADIGFVLKQGFPVVLFPESTTSSGDHVLPFKNSLFDAAIQTHSDIIPLCIRYTKVNGEPITHHTRDSIYFYGSMTYPDHVPRLMALKSVEVEVLPLKHIKAHADDSRKTLAAITHDAINTAYLG
jgi:1-acyl-sn-glycerol-3-phosphate acyltransferase